MRDGLFNLHGSIGWLFRLHQADKQRETLDQLALGLVCGMPLLRVFRQAGAAATWAPYGDALKFLAKSNETGVQLHEALMANPCRALPKWLRALLGSGLADQEMGAIMAARLKSERDEPDIRGGEFSYVAVQIAIASLVFLSLVMFVLPQFKEIFMGLNIRLPMITQLMLGVSDIMVNYWYFIVLPFFIGSFFAGKIFPAIGPFFWRRLFQGPEVLTALASLAALPPERVPEVMKILAHPLFLPHAHGIFSDLAEGMARGAPVDAILQRHGLEPLEAWLIRIGIETGETRDMFEQAGELLRCRLKHRFIRFKKGVETFLTLFVASVVGTICASVFLVMIRTLEVLL
ncbi:MAG: type II secretion system F family protein [Candidatus Ozemobacteraceae bacterium]